MKLFPSVFDARLMRNFFALVAIQGSNYIFPLITFPYLARVLGAGHFGKLAFAQATTQYLTLLVDFGFALTAARHVSQNKDDATALARVFWTTIYTKIALTGLSGVVLVALCVSLPEFREVAPLLLALFLTVVSSALLPTWLFQGTESMFNVTVITLATKGLYVPLIFIFIKTPDDLISLSWIQGWTSLAGAIFGFALALKGNKLRHYLPTPADIVASLRDSWHVFLSQAGVNLYTSTNVVLLRFTTNVTTVGLFVGAEKIRSAAVGINGVITNTFYPRISAHAHRDPASAQALIRKVFPVQVGVSAAISTFLFVFSAPIVAVLLGSKLLGAVSVLQILSPLPLLISVSHIYGVYGMLCFGEKVAFSRITLLGGAINIAVLPPLSFAYGANGAAASVVLTEVCIAFLMMRYSKVSLRSTGKAS